MEAGSPLGHPAMVEGGAHTQSPRKEILLALEAEVKGVCSSLKVGLLLKFIASKMELKVSPSNLVLSQGVVKPGS